MEITERIEFRLAKRQKTQFLTVSKRERRTQAEIFRIAFEEYIAKRHPDLVDISLEELAEKIDNGTAQESRGVKK